MRKNTAIPGSSLLLTGLVTALSSCVSVENAAPPVASLAGKASSSALPQLEEGRFLYLGKCTKCHSPVPIRKHNMTEWDNDILPVMNKKSRLTPAEAAALRAYIQAVRQQSAQS